MDFFIDVANFAALVEEIRSSTVFEILSHCPSSPFILITSSALNGVPVALHGFSVRSGFLVDKWNVTGLPSLRIFTLKVKASSVFPLRFDPNFGLLIPSKPEEICRYLYGPRWREPLEKNIDYKHAALFGKPVVLHGQMARFAHFVVKSIKRAFLK